MGADKLIFSFFMVFMAPYLSGIERLLSGVRKYLLLLPGDREYLPRDLDLLP